MLKADISLSDLTFDPDVRDGVIVLGESRISPFAHPSLETLLVCTEDQWFISVRERRSDQSPDRSISTLVVGQDAFSDLYRACLLWPLDYLLIEGAKQGCRLKVRAGVIGSAPVYFMAVRDRVIVSWDFSDFAPMSPWIDLEIISHYLALNTVYSSRQIYAGVNLLTERSTLCVEPGRASFRYPSPVEEASPQEQSRNARDVLQEFDGLLHRAITMRSMLPGSISAELSGGMDSATVACAVTATHGPIVSKGILLDGQVRTPQIERRQKIIAKLGLVDSTVDMVEFPPSFDLKPGRGRMELPNGEYYLEAFEALWDAIQRQACNVLFTGLGGDELFPVYIGETSRDLQTGNGAIEQERSYAAKLLTERARGAAAVSRTFDAPVSPVEASVLLAHVYQAPYLLQRGIWPVSPLGDPGLVAFCHRLPKEHRLDREVMQGYLRMVLGDVFPRSYVKETFVQVLPDAISKNAKMISAQLRTCALSDLGLVDQRAALKLLEGIVSTKSFALAAPFATFLRLERFVRRFN